MDRQPTAPSAAPLAPVSLTGGGGARTPGWQMQMRVDYVVSKVMLTHRGQSEESITQAIREQLRAFGVVPNGRQVAQYAKEISQLPVVPPRP